MGNIRRVLAFLKPVSFTLKAVSKVLGFAAVASGVPDNGNGASGPDAPETGLGLSLLGRGSAL